MSGCRWVALLTVLALAAPGAAREPGPKGTRPKGEPPKATQQAEEAAATLRKAQSLLEAVASGKPVTAAERRKLRSMLRDPRSDVATVAAWTLGRLKEKAALGEMAYRLEKRRKQAGFAGSAEEAFLRLAPLRMKKLTTRQAQAEWAKLLSEDPNPVVRAEAAREVVALRHPDALALLRQTIAWARDKDPAVRGVVLSQVAAALRNVGPQAVPDLQGLLRDASFPSFPYAYVLELEHCQTLMKTPCGEVETYHTVDAYARRALTLLTGESEKDAQRVK